MLRRFLRYILCNADSCKTRGVTTADGMRAALDTALLDEREAAFIRRATLRPLTAIAGCRMSICITRIWAGYKLALMVPRGYIHQRCCSQTRAAQLTQGDAPCCMCAGST
jgi:hypothetical protein